MSFQYPQSSLLLKAGANKGEQGFINKKEDSFAWSIVIAFSKRRIYGVVGTKNTFSSNEIKGFYYHIFHTKMNVFKEIEDPPIIVWDNSSIHKSSEIHRFIEGSNARILTITPYNPWLNPTEHLIGTIKSKVKVQLNQGRQVITHLNNLEFWVWVLLERRLMIFRKQI